ncbi:hypothetical protein QBC44DRAFT_84319 [Cladorrhinum sp. PSN332]|nr:hypothetical protein QBC44DRAFT_84319 [Cladorrhinum sp. PSN332]
MPQATMPRVFQFVAEFEKGIWVNSPDKATYDQQFNAKMQEWLRKRQMSVPELQNQLTVDAARQAQQQHQMQQQQQMMMSQMARMGQPGQPGFPHMQNAMQMGAMPPQAQMAMGMMNPGMVQNRPDQRQFPMQMQQPMPFSDVAQLTPADRQRLNEVAMAMMMKATEQHKASIRQLVLSQSRPEVIQECQQKNQDPAIIWFRSKALENLRATRMQQQQQHQQLQQQRNMVGANFMQPGPQGQMNPNIMSSLQQGNGQMMGANMEAIHNEHQKAILAQHSGQLVVPASSGPGRNATPGPIGGLPQQSIQQGLNQMPRGPMQQPFGMPPQNVKMENPMTAQQIQQAQQARALANHSMQGQPGALSGLPATSQSPGVNSLNAPLRQPPAPGGPPVNQGNPQIGTLNPTFNHNNNTRPQSVSGAMNNTGMTAGVGGALPDSSVEEVMKTWGQHQRPLMNTGLPNKPAQPSAMPGQLQGAQVTPNQLGVANAVQKPPFAGGTPQARAQILNFARTPNGKASMDELGVPTQVLHLVGNALKSQGVSVQGVDIRKWAQLWQFLQNHLPASRAQSLHTTLSQAHMTQFVNVWEAKMRTQAAQMASTPNGAPVSHVPANLQQQFPGHLPPGAMFPAQGFHATPGEIESFRKQQPGLAAHDDNSISSIIVNLKRRNWISKAWIAHSGGNNNSEVQRTPGQPNPTPFSQIGAPNPAAARQAPQLQTPAQKPAQKPTGTPGLDAVPNNIQRPQQSLQQPPQQQHQQQQQQSQQKQQQQQQPTRPNPSPAPVPTPALKNHNHLKRPSPDDAFDGVSQQGTAMQRSATQPSRPPVQMAKSSEADQAKPKTEQDREKEIREMREKQVAVLKRLGQEEQVLFASQPQAPVPMSPNEYNEAQRKINQLLQLSFQVKTKLAAWWLKTLDKEKARLYWKVQMKAKFQFEGGSAHNGFKQVLTYSHVELDHDRAILGEIVAECQRLGTENLAQVSVAQPAAGAPGGQRPPQPQPLSAENLEKFKAAPPRPMPKGGQPPPAPTTTQPPYQFNVQHSPAGNPHYLSEPSLSQDNLVIPPRKKVKPNAVAKPNPGSSSPVVKAPSPVVTRKPEPVIAAPKFACSEPSCQMSSIGFQTEEALKAHREEEHIKPFENPQEYLKEHMAAALGLDAQGHSKPPPKAVGQEAAPPLNASLSRQGQTPVNKVEMATPMSRDASMRRQGSAPGAKAGDNMPQMAPIEDGWAHATVDPSNLFGGLGHTLDAVTGNMIADFGAYRSVTPNDTPESTASKDSGISEPNSDITEGAALDIDLNWQPVESDLLYEMNTFTMNMEAMEGLDGYGTNMFDGQIALDEIQTDFSKPFVFDNSFYSMDSAV